MSGVRFKYGLEKTNYHTVAIIVSFLFGSFFSVKSQEGSNRKLQVDSLNRLAKSFYFSEIDSVYSPSIKALKLSNEIGYEFGAVYAQRNLGVYYAYAVKQDDEALAYFVKAHYQAKLYFETRSALKEAYAHEVYYTALQMANIFGLKGLFDQQQGLLSTAEEFLLLTDYNPEKLNLLKIHRGFAYNNLKEPEKALKLFKDAMAKVEKTPDTLLTKKDKVFIADMSAIIAGTYCSIDKYDIAQAYAEKSLRFATESNVSFLIAGSYFRMGEILIGKGNYDKALGVANIALEKSETHLDTILAYRTKGTLYFKQGNFENARKFLKPVLSYDLQKSRKDEAAETAQMLKKIYASDKDMVELTKVTDLLLSITDNMISDANPTPYLNMLKKNNRSTQKRIDFPKKSKTLLILFGSAFLVVGILFFKKDSNEKAEKLSH